MEIGKSDPARTARRIHEKYAGITRTSLEKSTKNTPTTHPELNRYTEHGTWTARRKPLYVQLCMCRGLLVALSNDAASAPDSQEEKIQKKFFKN